MSGFSFAGSDIGGFAEQPHGELYARWIQLATFHPFFRVHSSGDHGDQEPWTFDEDITDIVRKFIELRYQLLPYLYTAFWDYTERGVPLIKSLVMFDQEDVNTHYRIDEFIFGDSILACPVQEPNAKGRRMYIPRGEWYNYWTDEVVKGGKETWVDADIDSMPVFIKEGAIIPKYPVQQYVGERKIEEITLDIYYKKGKEDSQFFEDAQDGYDYTKGRFCLRSFKLTGRKNQLVIQQHKEGSYESDCKIFKLQIHGLPFEVKNIQLDNETKSLEQLHSNGCLTLMIDENFSILDLNGENEE